MTGGEIMFWIIGILAFLIGLVFVLPIWSVQWKPTGSSQWVTMSSYQIFWFANNTLNSYNGCGNQHRMCISLLRWWR